MKPAPRIIAFLLTLTLCLPNSALALRGQQQEDPSQLAGLEEALKDPAKVLRRLAQLITLAPSQTTETSFPNVRSEQPYAIERAGMEETPSKEEIQKIRLGLLSGDPENVQVVAIAAQRLFASPQTVSLVPVNEWEPIVEALLNKSAAHWENVGAWLDLWGPNGEPLTPEEIRSIRRLLYKALREVERYPIFHDVIAKKLSVEGGPEMVERMERLLVGLAEQRLFPQVLADQVPVLGRYLRESLEDNILPFVDDLTSKGHLTDGDFESIGLAGDYQRRLEEARAHIVRILAAFAEHDIAKQDVETVIGPLVSPLVDELISYGNQINLNLPPAVTNLNEIVRVGLAAKAVVDEITRLVGYQHSRVPIIAISARSIVRAASLQKSYHPAFRDAGLTPEDLGMDYPSGTDWSDLEGEAGSGLEETRYLSEDAERSRRLLDQVLAGKMDRHAFLGAILNQFFSWSTRPIPRGLIQSGEYRAGFRRVKEVTEEMFPIRAVSENLIQHSISKEGGDEQGRAPRGELARQLVEFFSSFSKGTPGHPLLSYVGQQAAVGEMDALEWAAIYYEIIRVATGERDAFEGIKRQANDTALKILPLLEAKIKRSAPDPLLAAIQAGIIGNVLDKGVISQPDLEEVIHTFEKEILEAIDTGPAWFTQAQYSELTRQLGLPGKDSKQILFLTDNAGEVVFDLLFIKQLLTHGHRVTLVGRGQPAVNDMTKKDLEELLKRNEVAQYFQGIVDWRERLSVISSGSGLAGTNLREATPEFLQAWLDSDIRIAKGQGNFETLSNNVLTRDIFYLFLAKESRMILDRFERGSRIILHKPAGPAAQLAGLEEKGETKLRTLRDQINLLPEAQTEQASVGVIAGPADPRGWAYGVALLKRARTATRGVIPVVFLVEDEDDVSFLRSLGVSPELVFRIGSAEYPTREVALREAMDYLHRGLEIPISSIIELGVSEEISPVVEQVLLNLFGIRLDAQAAVQWKEVIDAVVYTFRQA